MKWNEKGWGFLWRDRDRQTSMGGVAEWSACELGEPDYSGSNPIKT